MPALADVPSPAVRPPIATGKLVRSWFILLPLLYYCSGGFPGAADTGSAKSVSLTHQIGLLIVSVICATLIAKRFTAVFSGCIRMMPILALPVLALLSSAWSSDPRQSVVSGITFLCFMLFAIYISQTFTAHGLLDLIMLTGAIAVPASIALALFVPSIGATSAGWRGIFVHKQQCAAAVSLFLVTALHWKPGHALLRPLRAVYVILCLVLIVMSKSRTGWLLTLLAFTLYGGLRFLQKLAAKDALLVTITAIPVIGGLAYLFSLLSALILSTVGKDPTLTERTIIWAAAWDAIMQRPLLGYGYEAFWRGLQGPSKDVVLIAGWNLYQAQSGYLDLWLQLGVGGVILLALMTLQAAADAIRSIRRKANPSFVRWCIAVILCNLVYNIGESDMGYLRISWFLFVLACIGLNKEANATRVE